MTTPSVIHVVTAPDGGGAERLVRELVHRLPRHGINAHAIYYQNPRNLELSENESSLELQSVKGPVAWKRLRDTLQQQRKSELRGCFVHAHLTWPLLHVALLGKHIPGPAILTEHNTHNKRRNYPWLRPFERWLYRHYDRIVSISGGTREALEHWLADRELSDRMVTIVNGSRMLPFIERPGHSDQGCRLVSVGSLTYQKGFDVALRAIARAGNNIKHYTIIGEGPERPKLERIVDELGLRSTVRMPGYCSNVSDYFNEADLGIIPSRWEGFGLVAVEALSTGLPLVVSDVAGLRDVVADCRAAMVTPPEDEDTLQASIHYAIDNIVGRSDVSHAARQRAELFTIDAMVQGYAELYKNLV